MLGSAAEVARQSDVTIGMLADPAAALEVALGENGVVAGLSSGIALPTLLLPFNQPPHAQPPSPSLLFSRLPESTLMRQGTAWRVSTWTCIIVS